VRSSKPEDRKVNGLRRFWWDHFGGTSSTDSLQTCLAW
jgi:hypothetical protein